MSKPRWEQKLDSYGKALSRLAAIVNESKRRQLNEFEKDSVVQRFEFTHEMAWKVMMSYCKFVSPEEQTLSSKDSTRWAFHAGLLADGEVWMDMITSRNYTSHNYDGDIADMMVSKVADVYYPEMLKFHDVMKAKDPCFLLKITLKSAE